MRRAECMWSCIPRKEMERERRKQPLKMQSEKTMQAVSRKVQQVSNAV